MEPLDLINQNVQDVKEDVHDIKVKVGEISERLAVVEEKSTRRSLIISAIVAFLTAIAARLGFGP